MLAHLVTVHHWQVAVEHDHVVGRLRGSRQRRRAVMNCVYGHPGLAQALSDPPGQRRVILGNQHPHLTIMRQPG